MADIKTKEERSQNMAAIRSKNTKPEMLVRKYLFSRGLRFRACIRKVPRETRMLKIMSLVTRRAYLAANSDCKHEYTSTP